MVPNVLRTAASVATAVEPVAVAGMTAAIAAVVAPRPLIAMAAARTHATTEARVPQSQTATSHRAVIATANVKGSSTPATMAVKVTTHAAITAPANIKVSGMVRIIVVVTATTALINVGGTVATVTVAPDRSGKATRRAAIALSANVAPARTEPGSRTSTSGARLAPPSHRLARTEPTVPDIDVRRA